MFAVSNIYKHAKVSKVLPRKGENISNFCRPKRFFKLRTKGQLPLRLRIIIPQWEYYLMSRFVVSFHTPSDENIPKSYFTILHYILPNYYIFSYLSLMVCNISYYKYASLYCEHFLYRLYSLNFEKFSFVE